MTAISMQVVDTGTLSVDRQIKARKREIDDYMRLIKERSEWLAVLENRDKPNFRSVVQSRDQLLQNVEEAKYELYQLEQLL
jgi:hypothetical protein